MTKNILVSIVTITYNHEKYIEDALESFLNQKVDFTYEIIIADDASSDGTQKIIKKYANKYPDIIKPILRQKNIGAVPNSIDTLRHANGDYIALCEGDDYWIDVNKLQRQIDYMKANPNCALCFNPTKVVYDNDAKDATIWPTNITNKSLTITNLLFENYIPTNAVMYKRQNYDNLPNNVMPFDWYLHLYHAQFGEIGYIKDAMSIYRRHEGSMWWSSDSSPIQHWNKYGIMMFNLLEEVYKIYGKNKEHNKQIVETAKNLLISINKANSEECEPLIKDIIHNFESLSSYAVNEVLSDLKIAKNNIIDKTNNISKLESEVVELKAENFKLKAEVHSLRNSRVIGKIIKARETAGAIKRDAKHMPRKAIIRTKYAISSITPEGAKPPIRALVVKPAQKIIGIGDRRRLRRTATYQNSVIQKINHLWEMETVLVSVVVPYYNRADTIDETIDSLKKQTFKNFEVIIVNDGSTDQDSITKLKDLKKKNPTYVFLDQKNQGVAAARNNGIKKATGKYIICLDSDDMIEPTYIEKCSILLERNLDISLVTTYRKDFGVLNEETRTVPYDPVEIYNNNMVITAAQFKKEAWLASGGYKSGIGYEDWEYWLTLAEHGHWGKLLPELLFVYRVAMVSRFVQDKEAHWNNVKLIQNMHKQYNKKIEKIASKRRAARLVATNDTTLINLSNPKDYLQPEKSKKNVLVTIPWMTFGGAETLIYNYCREIKDDFSITFVTGLESKHEWEYKFREITPNIYHLTNLFDDTSMYIEFLSNYIKTRGVDILHIIHNGFTFEMLPELKKRHPKLKVIVTMFNDRVEHFNKSLEYAKYIDVFTSDNGRVINHYKNMLGDGIETVVIPNGIDCYTTFKLGLFERDKERKNLGIEDGEIAVFFVGRLSEEKNPNVFVDAAKDILKTRKKLGIKFFVVGDGGMKQQIEEMIKAVDSSSIKYLGYQSDVAKYLSAADVFVLPSSIEGFPLSILEAMAMKVAVVASDVGAVAEVIENKVDGFVVTPGDSQEISDAIIVLEKDRDLLEDMKIRSRKKVEKNYSNKILGKHYTDLYKGTK